MLHAIGSTIRFRSRLRAALSDDGGNIAMIFAFALVPLLGASGAAIDYSRAASFKARLQTAVDETALRSFDVAHGLRLASAETRLSLLGEGYENVTITGNDDEVEVSATGRVKTTILAVIGIDEIPVAARAIAAAARRGPKACLLALNTEDSNAVSFSGNSSFVGKDCAVYSNSRDPNGLTISGNAWPQAAGFCSVGGAAAPAGFTPPPRTRCRAMTDPFAHKIQPPDVGKCDFSNHTVGPQQDEELKPGVYCGGLTVRGTARLKAGETYVFKDGELQVNSQGSLLGTDVLLYLTGPKSGFTINGGGDVRLHAAKKGPYGGVVIYQDPLSNPGAENKLNGSSTTVIDGAIYTPGNSVRINGSSGFGQKSVYMPVIADKITVTGSTDMRIDLNEIEMIAPIPEMGQSVRLVE
jgi:hypothetical protein